MLASSLGEEVSRGREIPSGDRILGLLRDQGLVPRWEQRKAFLKDQPKNGEVWREELAFQVELARRRLIWLSSQGRAEFRKVPGIRGDITVCAFTEVRVELRERLADDVFSDLAEALRGLGGVEEWWKFPLNYRTDFSHLGVTESPRMRAELGHLAENLEAQLVEWGPEQGLLENWILYRILSGQSFKDMSRMVIFPDDIRDIQWRLRAVIEAFLDHQAPEGALAFLDALPTDLPSWRSELRWKDWCWYRSDIAGFRMRALWGQGRMEAARQALAEYRAWGAGRNGISLSPQDVGNGVLSEGFVKQALDQAAPPLPPEPAQPVPVQILLLGKPDWIGPWMTLPKSDALVAWGPEELSWVQMPVDSAERLRARMGWGVEARWVIMQGDKVLASGEHCPSPNELASMLQRENPSRLQQLNRWIQKYPGHLGARRARVSWIRRHLPDLRLERYLAEDARLVCKPTEPFRHTKWSICGAGGEWQPDPRVWQRHAEQILPELENLIRSWPNNIGYWVAWLEWSRRHPLRPSVTALAQDLNLWKGDQSEYWKRNSSIVFEIGQRLKGYKDRRELERWRLAFSSKD